MWVTGVHHCLRCQGGHWPVSSHQQCTTDYSSLSSLVLTSGPGPVSHTKNILIKLYPVGTPSPFSMIEFNLPLVVSDHNNVTDHAKLCVTRVSVTPGQPSPTPCVVSGQERNAQTTSHQTDEKTCHLNSWVATCK